MTAQPEHSQCPLVEMDSITSMFIVYRYDSTTGTFTVPPGGDGYYYFSTYVTVWDDEFGRFDLQVNGEILCSPHADQTDTPSNPGQAACSGVTYAMAGLFFSRAVLQLCSFFGVKSHDFSQDLRDLRE